MKKIKKAAALLLFLMAGVGGCMNANEGEEMMSIDNFAQQNSNSHESQVLASTHPVTRYGVFLSLSGRDAVTASEGYETVVIDAQNLSPEEVAEMKARGQKVYSYINLGSLEDFRSYFDAYKHLSLKLYENWEEEYWMDVSNKEWQDFVGETLANQLLEKGVDGFWVDNVDVYYQYPTQETYAGVETILKKLMSYQLPVIINGGDEFVRLYWEKNQHLDDILTGVNQESVFSTINFDEGTLGTQGIREQNYYLDYLNLVNQAGKQIFLLEYTTSEGLASTIHSYTQERRWSYYISDSIELD